MDRLVARRPPRTRRQLPIADIVGLGRPPARAHRLADLRAAERRRNRELLHVTLPESISRREVHRAAEPELMAVLAHALGLSLVAWLLIEVILPLLLQLAGAPYD